MTTMRATIRTEYGPPDVLHGAELPAPVAGPGQVLIRVRRTSVNYGDLTARDFRGLGPDEFNMPAPLFYAARLGFGWSRPRNPLLGSEYAGEVEAVGPGVTTLAPGDVVFGYRGQRMGAYAEYLVEKADGMVVPLPDGVSTDDAAVLAYGSSTAVGLLRPLGSLSGASVMIVGASGSIGMAALQILVADGARVTAVAGPRSQALVMDLGAEAALDYTRVRAMDPAASRTGPFDLVLDIRGRAGFDAASAVLTARGRYVPVSFKTRALLHALRTRRAEGQRVVVRLAPERREHLEEVARRMADGTLRAAIGQSFDLDAAAEAHRAAEAGETTGHILLRA
jgi:NADPH:quinone reductase-like Zn-dependent oxidoreductase